jgi:glycosyltransferase involved in cell wall biosynthesis
MHILVITHRAVHGTGPARNILTTLGALLEHTDARVSLVAEELDQTVPWRAHPRFRWFSDFHPKRPAKWSASLATLRRAAADANVIWVPANTASLLLAQSVRIGRPLVCGPNITPLPIRRADSPGFVEAELLCDRWIEASQARLDHVNRRVRSSRLERIPHAIDPRIFDPALRSPTYWRGRGLTGAGPIALFTGRDYALKGLAQLLDAMDLVNAGRSVPVQLGVIGDITPAHAERVRNCPWAVATGRINLPEISTAFASADFAVSPSSWESFSYVVLESQASGLPAICGDRGGPPEIVADEQTGLVVKIAADGDGLHLPDAPATLARAIGRLADAPGLRERMGAAARERAVTEFSEKKIAERMMSLFESLLR